jgi:transposase-like protein
VALEAVRGQKTLNELASEFGVHPVQVTQWKRQLLDASPGIFESGSASRREQEQLVAQLYQQIRQLKMEVDWLQKKA